MLKREPGGDRRPGEARLGGESAGCSGTPPPATGWVGGGRRAHCGEVWARQGGSYPQGGSQRQPSSSFSSSMTTPEGPGPRLHPPPTPRIPEHPRASCTPGWGEESAREAEEGASQERESENLSPAPALSSGLPLGNTGCDPL